MATPDGLRAGCGTPILGGPRVCAFSCQTVFRLKGSGRSLTGSTAVCGRVACCARQPRSGSPSSTFCAAELPIQGKLRDIFDLRCASSRTQEGILLLPWPMHFQSVDRPHQRSNQPAGQSVLQSDTATRRTPAAGGRLVKKPPNQRFQEKIVVSVRVDTS